MPKKVDTMLRPTLDNALPITTQVTMKTYEITLSDNPFLVDNPIGTDLVKVTHPDFAPHGKYYSRRHLKETPTDSSHTHTITVPVTRRSGTNFEQPEKATQSTSLTGALGKRLAEKSLDKPQVIHQVHGLQVSFRYKTQLQISVNYVTVCVCL